MIILSLMELFGVLCAINRHLLYFYLLICSDPSISARIMAPSLNYILTDIDLSRTFCCSKHAARGRRSDVTQGSR